MVGIERVGCGVLATSIEGSAEVSQSGHMISRLLQQVPMSYVYLS